MTRKFLLVHALQAASLPTPIDRPSSKRQLFVGALFQLVFDGTSPTQPSPRPTAASEFLTTLQSYLGLLLSIKTEHAGNRGFTFCKIKESPSFFLFEFVLSRQSYASELCHPVPIGTRGPTSCGQLHYFNSPIARPKKPCDLGFLPPRWRTQVLKMLSAGTTNQPAHHLQYRSSCARHLFAIPFCWEDSSRPLFTLHLHVSFFFSLPAGLLC